MTHFWDLQGYCMSCGVARSDLSSIDPCGTQRWHYYGWDGTQYTLSRCAFCGRKDDGNVFSLIGCPGSHGPAALSSEPVTPLLNEPAPSPTCLTCDRELSKTLDAYYGTDPYDAKRCAPCRSGRAT